MENHSNSRRSFIRNLSFGSLFLLSGQWVKLNAEEVYGLRKKVRLRFAVASDAHYGQPKTDYDDLLQKCLTGINRFHENNTLDFCVLNGDIIHNNPSFLPLAKQKIEQLAMPWFVTRGNHDMVNGDTWQSTFNMPLNHDSVVKNTALVLGDTSNEQGTYLSPDLVWLKEKLDAHTKLDSVFIFLHIPQALWTKNAVDTPAFFELIDQYPNIKAVFHGHEHDQDGIMRHKQIPFFFDAHIGGNWGTEYHGFRVVELMNDNSFLTYMMNPTEKMKEDKIENRS